MTSSTNTIRLAQFIKAHSPIVLVALAIAVIVWLAIKDAAYMGADQGSYLLHSDLLRGRELRIPEEMWPRTLLAPGYPHMLAENLIGITATLKLHAITTVLVICFSIYYFARAYLSRWQATLAPVIAFMLPTAGIHNAVFGSPQGILVLGLLLIALRLIHDTLESKKATMHYVGIGVILALIPHAHQSVALFAPAIVIFWIALRARRAHARLYQTISLGWWIGYVTALPWYLGGGDLPIVTVILDSAKNTKLAPDIKLVVQGIVFFATLIVFRKNIERENTHLVIFSSAIMIMGCFLDIAEGTIVTDGVGDRIIHLAAMIFPVSVLHVTPTASVRFFNWWVASWIFALSMTQTYVWGLHSITKEAQKLDIYGVAEILHRDEATGYITNDWLGSGRGLSAISELPAVTIAPYPAYTVSHQDAEKLPAKLCILIRQPESCDLGESIAMFPRSSHVVWDKLWEKPGGHKVSEVTTPVYPAQHLELIGGSERISVYRINKEKINANK